MPMLAHNVYFSLNDKSPAAKKKLVKACKKYLADQAQSSSPQAHWPRNWLVP